MRHHEAMYCWYTKRPSRPIDGYVLKLQKHFGNTVSISQLSRWLHSIGPFKGSKVEGGTRNLRYHNLAYYDTTQDANNEKTLDTAKLICFATMVTQAMHARASTLTTAARDKASVQMLPDHQIASLLGQIHTNRRYGLSWACYHSMPCIAAGKDRPCGTLS
mmetsp:Transcript_32063/g.46596  ORF Transcript_32063/g.46596 Transcript_32063/m.46596 type:complete len:161 (-) Transcript_32063:698-1180(-)